MSALSLHLVARAVARLPADVGKPTGVRTWLLEGGYYLDQNSTGDSLKILTNDVRDYLAYVSFDYARFALSSWESYSVARFERDACSVLSWPLIKLYYAAFFAAHALMRADGGGIIRLERDQAKRLTDFGKLTIGDDFSVAPGNYEIFAEQEASGQLEVRLVRLSESGGAHDGFWRRFSAYLSEVERRAVDGGEPNANQIVAEVTALQSVLRAAGGDSGTWLSIMRNKINYQHDYGVWFPTKGSHDGYQAIDSARDKETGNIRLDYNPSKSAIRAFVSTSHFLSCLSQDVATQVASKYSGATGFGSKWRRLTATIGGHAAASTAA